MSVHAGTIIHVGGNNVIDRVQNAGLGDARVATDVIREVGNPEVVDKVKQEPDFTFTLESFDTSAELEAFLSGAVGAGGGSAQAPGASDPDGTEYKWSDCGFLNIASPWKDPLTGSAGDVTAGHLVPAYYPRRLRYRFGVTDNASQEVELAGASYFYADAAPVEQFETGDGNEDDFVTDEDAVGYRKGGVEGTTFRRVFGVIVNGEIMIPDVDYSEVGAPQDASAAPVTVHFTVAPDSGADIRFVYFSQDDHSYPQSVHPLATVKPGAVRGRNICVFLGSGTNRAKVGSVQSVELEATVDATPDRELCNEEIVGRTINGRDTNGTLVVRSKNAQAFLDLISKVTGVPSSEVIGWLNLNDIPLEVQIQNPKNPGEILKTLYVSDAIFQVPATPARVNTPTDFSFTFESRSGEFSAFKGEKPA